jgi:cell wall-associated NlpC family hydrolase
MIATPDMMVEEARKWLGTPFHHQGRALGAGVDCAGVAVAVARAFGLPCSDASRYARSPSEHTFRAVLAESCDPIPFDQLRPGDLMSFAFLYQEQHVAVVAPPAGEGRPWRMIHAWQAAGRCVENDFDSSWQRRLRGCWRWKGT